MALKGVKVIELAGLAPAPFCGMILSDFGATVTRIDKVGHKLDLDRLSRGKRSICVDLKSKAGVNIVQRLTSKSDVLIDPYRAGVLEKLGLGPSILLNENPQLIFARLTGYGQTGPYADKAGHDINYLATAGVLSILGRKNEKPLGPINLLADFAGGGLMCALGISLALLERAKTGKGQVIDADMVRGSAYVSSFLWLTRGIPMLWGSGRGENALDGGVHYYDTYLTKDSKYMAVGALEPQFYANLLKGLGLAEDDISQLDVELGKQKFTEIFATKTRDEWTKVFDKLDACVTPVMDLEEAHDHPHNKHQDAYVASTNGYYAPVPAPKLSSTKKMNLAEPAFGQHTKEVLLEAGYADQDISNFIQNGTVEYNNPVSKL